MADPRDTYDLPRRVPVPARHWALMVGMVLLAPILWLLLPSTALSVALMVILVLGAVFLGVASVLRSRQLSEPPGRNPVPPPSTEPHG